jgi:tRNA-specific 2-thiouridylase
MSGEKVIVGLSGGVDSAVSALLLQQQGYRVEALFMKNWEEDDREDYCSAAEDLADAEAVCARLGIELHSVNFSAEYWDRVFAHFLDEYRAGRTPNPDVLCNREIKFRAFLDHARERLDADFIATGHYVQKRPLDGDRAELLRGRDANKDQSYFLYAIDGSQIARSLFPVGHLEKPEVRTLAEQAGLPVFAKKDSTGICFIGERKFRDFLQRFLPAQPGEIETLDGERIGEHGGLMYYTLGQRQGLGIGGLKQAGEAPWFVVDKDLERNVLIVAQGHDHPALFRRICRIGQLHWINPLEVDLPMSLGAKIRYRQADQPCRLIEIDGDRAVVVFDQPQRAVTPGQALVFYRGEVCLGGGTIEQAWNPGEEPA